ncbi:MULTISPECIES: hypothetical protein [Desulfovibrio]|uniref:hypothetical protein n=1 Tax=Desulfovibrio TaxID=872 RepID=UPI0026F07D30|nr:MULTISPECIES: hypothetical protein [Desulfovibrio]MCI7616707.1 hypothetical protein [Desulfovibrio piger]MDY4806695.1 hypothetical protein [Desulfovibrio sp.]
MDDTLERFLSSAGITCFIRDFEWFLEAERSYSNVDAANFLHKTYGYTVTAFQTRVSKARKIIANKMTLCSCLEYISCKAGRNPVKYS